MKLLESSAQEAGKGKTLVPKAIDADDEDNPRDSDDDSDDDDEASPIYSICLQILTPICRRNLLNVLYCGEAMD